VNVDEQSWDLSDAGDRAAFEAIRSALYVEGYQGGDATLTLEYPPKDANVTLADNVNYHFIAADCGKQPETDNGQRDAFATAFPGLVHCEWSILSGYDASYNCIAWSVDEDNFWYQKLDSIPGTNYVGIDEVYGDNDGVFEVDDDMDPFYLAKKGYTPTAVDASDALVMYFSGYHGAKRKSCSCGAGQWIMYESKCGKWERIEHVYDQLNASSYGSPVRYYK